MLQLFYAKIVLKKKRKKNTKKSMKFMKKNFWRLFNIFYFVFFFFNSFFMFLNQLYVCSMRAAVAAGKNMSCMAYLPPPMQMALNAYIHMYSVHYWIRVSLTKAIDVCKQKFFYCLPYLHTYVKLVVLLTVCLGLFLNEEKNRIHRYSN